MNDVDDSDHELTDEQRDKLRKAIGEIIGDFTPWILCVDTTPIIGDSRVSYSSNVSSEHASVWWDKDKNAVAISYKDNRLILTVDDAQALLRQLEMLLPERPSRDEPEEPGFYRTRTGAFLRKNENGAWSALFINGDLIPRYWNDQDDYAKWRTVLDCLYPRAFPLTPTTAPYPLKGE